EVPATVFAGNKELVTLLATPTYLDELAVGFLYSSGFVDADADFGDVTVDAGLSDGQEIVVSGASQLEDGAAVRRFVGFGD
ncbi:hypothetical protein LCGC14_2210860, partial [marine sediment metagenome]